MNFTFLKEDQIWGDDALDVMKRYGTKVAPTDLAVILGCCNYQHYNDLHTSEGDLTCSSWSASSDDREGVRCVDYHGDQSDCSAKERCIGAVRPVLPKKEASKIKPTREWTDDKGIQHCEFGEYPQTVVKFSLNSNYLERLYTSGSLRQTGKFYTFDSVDPSNWSERDTHFRATPYPEYEVDGKRYIRISGRFNNNNSMLSDGYGAAKKPYWVEVQPIEWLMDKSGTMVAKKCLFAGIQFDTKEKYDGDFSKTFMKRYLDTFFAEEMMPLEQTLTKDNEETKEPEEEAITKIKILRTIVETTKNVSSKKGEVNPKLSPKKKVAIKKFLDSMHIDSI